MKYIFLILTLTFSLLAQYDWSDPITISNSEQNGQPTMGGCQKFCVNGIFHSFYIAA
jgi:hypothetical protein